VVALDGSINVASVGNGEADDALEDLSDLEHSSTSQEEQELFVEQAWADKDPPQTQAQHDHPPPPPPPPCTETPQKPQKQQQQQFQQVSNEASQSTITTPKEQIEVIFFLLLCLGTE
jgi:hypothetical protein